MLADEELGGAVDVEVGGHFVRMDDDGSVENVMLKVSI